MRTLIVPLLLILAIAACQKAGEDNIFPRENADGIPVYKDPEQKIEDRVEDLLSRMTLQEKVAQISSHDIWTFPLRDKEFYLDVQMQFSLMQELKDGNKIEKFKKAVKGLSEKKRQRK